MQLLNKFETYDITLELCFLLYIEYVYYKLQYSTYVIEGLHKLLPVVDDRRLHTNRLYSYFRHMSKFLERETIY